MLQKISQTFATSFLGMVLLFLLPVSSAEAQFTCTGAACAYLPSGFTTPLNSTFNQIETKYLDEVMKTNTEASFLNNLVVSNVGSGTVRRIQVGASVSAAGARKDDIAIQSDAFRLPNLPNVGASLVPTFHLDFNPGWILGKEDRHWSRRFGVFLHGMKLGISESNFEKMNPDDAISGKLAVRNYGGMVRYQVFERQGFLLNLITWNGLNVGVGHHVTETNLSLNYQDDRATKVETRGLRGQWGGANEFDFNTKARTSHIDARTGIGLFWMLDLIVGGGYSWNSGESDISFARTGPFSVQLSGPPAVELPPNFSTNDPLLRGISEGGTLGVQARGDSSVRRRIGYGIIGLELDIYLVKVILEGVYGGKDLYSANLGVKASF